MKKNSKESKQSEISLIGVTISPPENLNKRILGSYSSVEKFKRKDDDGFPDDFPDDGDYPPPPPPISSPDIALQFQPAFRRYRYT